VFEALIISKTPFFLHLLASEKEKILTYIFLTMLKRIVVIAEKIICVAMSFRPKRSEAEKSIISNEKISPRWSR